MRSDCQLIASEAEGIAVAQCLSGTASDVDNNLGLGRLFSLAPPGWGLYPMAPVIADCSS